jgi:hypothetical protein
MDTYGLDVESWAEQNFGECDFNDKRLTDRWVAHLVQNRVGWIVRACRLNRLVHRKSNESTPNKTAKSQSLASILDVQPCLGTYERTVKENRHSPARVAKVQVRCANIWMPRPLPSSPWAKEHAPSYIAMGGVEVRELDAKKGGFLGRKSDGKPGWITIWPGVKDLLQFLRLQKALRNVSDDETCG